MNDNKDTEDQVEQTNRSAYGTNVPGSPNDSIASRSSSSRQEQRVVELLPESRSVDNPPAEYWHIAQGFYDEDVAAVDHSIQDEDWNLDEDEGEDHDIDVDSEVHDSDSGSYVDDDMIILGYHNNGQPSDSDSYDEVDHSQAINYDITLPIGHRYLGENLEEARGRQFLVDDSITMIHLINLRHVVLLPGQVLPLTTINLNPRIHMYLKMCIARGISLIGLMSHPRENQIGTTAEIRNYSEQDENLRIIMEGRQRFRLLSQPFETAIEAQVRILPEITLGRPYTLPPSRRKFLLNKSANYDKIMVAKQPKWLLRQHEASYIVDKIIDQIRNWCSVGVTSDPNQFSYWVAANLSISNHERMKVLRFGCTEERLLWLLEMLERSEYFGCSICKNVICHKKDVFPMSCTGPQNSFVNSHGFVHDTITVRAAKGLIQDQGWSSEFSWFPGYSWRVACCDVCNRHIGWCYKSDTETKPKKFFGLSRLNIRLQSASDQSSSSHQASGDMPYYRVVRPL